MKAKKPTIVKLTPKFKAEALQLVNTPRVAKVAKQRSVYKPQFYV